jgi:hypothetical protein
LEGSHCFICAGQKGFFTLMPYAQPHFWWPHFAEGSGVSQALCWSKNKETASLDCSSGSPSQNDLILFPFPF